MVNNTKTVVIVAECWNGAGDAARFVARNLFDHSTHVVLLYSYKKPAGGIMMLRDITKVLKKIAEEELMSLKKVLINDMGLPEDSIENMVIESELESAIRTVLDNRGNISIVLGTGTQNQWLNSNCKKIINTVLKSRLYPVFLVSENITIIEESGMTIIADKENSINEGYLDFLKEISCIEEPGIRIVANDNRNWINLDRKTAVHFAIRNQPAGGHRTVAEHVLHSRMNSVSSA